MASDRKVAANRRNSRRSSGPRTVAGKLTVSRNALRHGLAAVTIRDLGIAAEVDRLATAIGGAGSRRKDQHISTDVARDGCRRCPRKKRAIAWTPARWRDRELSL